jgi:hypothetical protein
MGNMLIVPVRIIFSGFAFLYLVLPIPFVDGIRELAGFGVYDNFEYTYISILGIFIFFVVSLVIPNELLIDKFYIKKNIINIDILFKILTLFFLIYLLYVLHITGINFYENKVEAHNIYESISSLYNIRLLFNIILILLILDLCQNGFSKWHLIFFISPVLLEAAYSKHSYITLFLVYLYIYSVNKIQNRKIVYIAFITILVSLLFTRYILYSSSEGSVYSFFSAIFGEFNLSWQSSFLSFKYSGDQIKPLFQLYPWYSDYFTAMESLPYGLAGNPIAESIFYYGEFFAPFILMLYLLGLFFIFKLARKYQIFAVSSIPLIFYCRDLFRFGFSGFISIYIKSLLLIYILFIIKKLYKFKYSSYLELI